MTDAEIRSRTEAVSFLRKRGYHAFERDWSLGETIGVAAEPSMAGTIEVWKRVVYLAPSPKGWVLYNLMHPPVSTSEPVSLHQACLLAIHTLAAEKQ